jgi:hypothetical protein
MMTLLFTQEVLDSKPPLTLSERLKTGLVLSLSNTGNALFLFEDGEKIAVFPLDRQFVQLVPDRSLRDKGSRA